MSDDCYCRKCRDTQWVCENHPDQVGHECHHCNGAAMPCTCSPLHGAGAWQEGHAEEGEKMEAEARQ